MTLGSTLRDDRLQDIGAVGTDSVDVAEEPVTLRLENLKCQLRGGSWGCIRDWWEESVEHGNVVGFALGLKKHVVNQSPTAETNVDLSVQSLEVASLAIHILQPGHHTGVLHAQLRVKRILSILAVNVETLDGIGHLLLPTTLEILQIVQSSQCLREIDALELLGEATTQERAEEVWWQRAGLRWKTRDLVDQLRAKIGSSVDRVIRVRRFVGLGRFSGDGIAGREGSLWGTIGIGSLGRVTVDGVHGAQWDFIRVWVTQTVIKDPRQSTPVGVIQLSLRHSGRVHLRLVQGRTFDYEKRKSKSGIQDCINSNRFVSDGWGFATQQSTGGAVC